MLIPDFDNTPVKFGAEPLPFSNWLSILNLIIVVRRELTYPWIPETSANNSSVTGKKVAILRMLSVLSVNANAPSPAEEMSPASAISAALFVNVVSSRYTYAFWSVLIWSNNPIIAFGSLKAVSNIPGALNDSGG